jgi:hypothetical protein
LFCLLMVLVLGPVLAVLAGTLRQAMGFEVRWNELAVGVAGGVASVGVAFGVAVSVAFVVAVLGLHLQPVAVAAQVMALLRGRLSVSPVLWMDLIRLPLPWLGRQIETSADAEPGLVRRVLDACGRSPGLVRTAERATARLQAGEVRELLSGGAGGRDPGSAPRRLKDGGRQDCQSHSAEALTRDLFELRGLWLPGEQTEGPLWNGVREIARYLRSAQEALRGFENQLLTDRSELGVALRETIPAWREAIARVAAKALERSKESLPNPFITGNVPKWHEQIGDATVAEGILDRIVHCAHRFELKGESLRKNPPKAPADQPAG